jgi:UPF0716 family protein affecting phage T7 exclusion
MSDLRPTRHITIQPALPWWEIAGMFVIAAVIGFWLAVGHS